ncbi:MAG: polysaccharide biosynthesis/export family protein [Novosphingobium sp.]
MIRFWALMALAFSVFALGGCAHSRSIPLPVGEAAYTAMSGKGDVLGDDIIRTGDHLSIRVMGEPELTSDAYIVDGKGAIQVPLAGEVLVAGRTTSEVRDDLTQRLGARYIRSPQVSVGVSERRRMTFAVEGDVREPGIFDAVPGTTLLSAIAQAKSTTDTAKLDEVMVFRVQNGQRLGARFNISDIREGRAADPMILPGDTVVVGRSGLKESWKQFLQAVPLLNLFYVFK